ncbi:MAG: Membrane flavodoxin oxidoreductase [Candidatus Collierbacteria bacterium GW2011_GWC1_45_47]|uniref:FAD-binding FR-type domain-containing protein n=5 Tax=Candidatus Collieribacteriota TaxID=1752725 RepID=A0A0G1KD95_9BACT|nr:MAG: hypothetical protein UW23_C0021G0013 [Candidatus Collierbacteria bacterium GW2011_GWA1_44_12]KKT45794.1 MAG: hypothetical protein UW35_C0032G0014 [Candidatus Collierbacteria bacterium GW2011_GWF2_44_15]KKT67571.1 MAG: hypothetical protein UW62_C0022G0010 [Candidatus Collierbacteria bacterium GW2011_GWB1_44_35]KKT97949.1 MAG: hypothetical protein UW99_C0028G0006 [Candidatus Collierbacteria bacterium GW2011_GWC2_45_15]KKU09286.1 MAG: Membrane flavodoxin oxidoreductase [Candidatus Collierb
MKNRGLFLDISLVSITAILFFLSKPTGFITDYPLLSAAQLFALLGVTLVCLNFFISTRSRTLAWIYGGFDVMFKHHHNHGAIAFTLLLFHPLLMFFNALPQKDLAMKFIFYSDVIAYNLGLTALLILTLTLIFTFLIKLPYHIWLLTHRFLGLFLIVASLHIFFIGSDISYFLPLKIWIYSLLFLALASLAYRRLLYYLLAKTYFYKVTKIAPKGDIYDVYLYPEKGSVEFFPGQFAFVTFIIPTIRQEPLPLSFASGPENPTLRFTVRSLGDQTKSIKENLKIGSRVRVDGPHGLFADDFSEKQDVVFISGGIGIAPFLSLLENEKNHPTGKKIIHYSSFKTKEEAFCHQELISYSKTLPGYIYEPLFTDTSPRLTAVQIKERVGDIKKFTFFICGPVPMMLSLRDQLLELGVRQSRIRFENFSFK